MSGLIVRALPGVAAAAVAAGSVLAFDQGFKENNDPDMQATPQAEAAPKAAAPRDADPEAAPAAPCAQVEELAGRSAGTPWGPVQVTAQVSSDGTLCDVRATVYPDADRKSSMINAEAVPILNARAMEQGIAFDAVSGATYTSEAYRESLQALLDSL